MTVAFSWSGKVAGLRKECSVLGILSFRESNGLWAVGLTKRNGFCGSHLESSQNSSGGQAYIEGTGDSKGRPTWTGWVERVNSSINDQRGVKGYRVRGEPGDRVSGKLWEKFHWMALTVRCGRTFGLSGLSVSRCCLAPPAPTPPGLTVVTADSRVLPKPSCSRSGGAHDSIWLQSLGTTIPVWRIENPQGRVGGRR